jgi:DNA (cytosine-5)-methyltransferase 3A
MKVVSLFDGISCAYVALQKSGIPITSYTAYEIDKYAIMISKKNHPTIDHKGNVKDLKEAVECDILIGGSPCTDLSVAKKDRKGLEGKHSSLFWEYIRIKNLLNPKWFILENVASMSKTDKDAITKAMGVEPIMICASLVSAQRRKRYFWTNIPCIQPSDKGILLKHILEDTVDQKYYIKQTKEELGDKVKSQGYRVYNTDGKSACLSANGGGVGAKTGLYTIVSMIGRRLDKDGKRCDEDEAVDYEQRVAPKRDQSKSGTLTGVQKDNLLMYEDRIRRLTPLECERLQGLPDGYTAHVSDTQRYKCCGNAFNCDVVAHILRGIPVA